MGRQLDDDARSRTDAAEHQLREAGRLNAQKKHQNVRTAERDLARIELRWRVRLVAVTIAVGSALAGVGWTGATWGASSKFIGPDLIFGTLTVLATIAAAINNPTFMPPATSDGPRRYRADLKEALETAREEYRFANAVAYPSLGERRSLYREDVADLIEQYQSDSRRYRRVHNSLQVLIMTGSAASTTVAALDWGQQPTWQSITLTGISFAVTMAAAFTGYYKYRERSYFLQETADAIEEQANALTLGVGEYASLEDDEKGALALFTANVERLRNEQRRRQQQLDQPSEQTTTSGTAPS